MSNFDTRTYSIADIVEWDSNGLLKLDPEFQRRAVWNNKGKSYLIDTILRGKPMPKLLITQKIIGGRNQRTVVDGQQRIRSILEFLADDFAVLQTHNSEFGGCHFSDLGPEVKQAFLQYNLGFDVLYDMPLSDLLDIFARLNTYSVKLNSTEKLNAKYLGSFKNAVHRLGGEYVDFYLEAGLFTPRQVSRMDEVSLTADLLGALLEGIGPKAGVARIYDRYDDSEEEVREAEAIFRQCMDFLSSIYSPNEIRNSEHSRLSLFYSIFLALAYFQTGRPDLGIARSERSPKHIRYKLDLLSDEIGRFRDRDSNERDFRPDFTRFVNGIQRSTTDKTVREFRTHYVAEWIIS